jgi:heme exporter protein D
MKFADFAAAAGLAFYAEVALGLFLVAFVAVAVSLLTANQAKEMERRRRLPLGDDALVDIIAEGSAKEPR